MNHDNLAISESIVQNDSVITNVSEEGGEIVVADSINSKENLDRLGTTQPETLSQTGKVVQGVWQLGGKVAGISSNVAKSAMELGQSVVKSATGLGQEAAKSALSQKQVQEAILVLGNNTQALQAAKEASVEAHVKQVNLTNVKKSIKSLKKKFPTKTSEEIAQEVVVQQTLKITRNSTVITMFPGKSAESMGFDQAALALTQAETIYQIAEAYAFDLNTPERREEAFIILDRAFRSVRQMKMSMNLGVVPTLPIVGGLLSVVPILGGVLNVGSDAFLIALIGHTACQLYREIMEEKVTGEALKTFKQETQIRYKKHLW